MPQCSHHRTPHTFGQQTTPDRGPAGRSLREVPPSLREVGPSLRGVGRSLRGVGRSLRGAALGCVVTALLVCAPGFWPAAGSDGTAGVAWARSAYTARNPGIDPPGGPKPMEGLPGKNVSRTSEGGMGYTDAYGNTVTDSQPEEKAQKRRPGPGAYGNRGAQEHNRPLPDPTPKDTTPAWNYN